MERKMFEVDTTHQLVGIGICWSADSWKDGWNFFGILFGPLVFRLNWKSSRFYTPNNKEE